MQIAFFCIIAFLIAAGLIVICSLVDLAVQTDIEQQKKKRLPENSKTMCNVIEYEGTRYLFRELNDKYWKLYEEILEKGDVPVTYKEYV